MKYVVVVIVVVLVAWWTLRPRRAAAPPRRAGSGPKRAQPMIACAHCGVHLPASDAVSDAQGRSYCSDAHRLAGPQGGSPGR